MSTFGGLDTLFNPAKRHLDEEKLRLQSTREDIGDASGGKRIDLDSGRVKIARAQSPDDAEVLAGDDPADDPATPVAATTAGTVRTDADADADPAAEGVDQTAPSAVAADQVAAGVVTAEPAASRTGSDLAASRPVASHRAGAKRGQTRDADDENTPAARARRRRAPKL